MSINRVKQYLKQWNRDGDVVELTESTATVPLAAAALGVIPARIAKSITLRRDDGGLLVVAAGDARVDNKLFKQRFGKTPRMLSAEDAHRLTGYMVGGICPFDLPSNFPVYLDRSLQRFESIFPACGSSNSMIQLTITELEIYSDSQGWVEVCSIAE